MSREDVEVLMGHFLNHYKGRSKCTYLAYLGLLMTAPGALDQIRSRVIEGASVESAGSLFAVLFLVVMIMAFPSLNLKYSTNRWASESKSPHWGSPISSVS